MSVIGIVSEFNPFHNGHKYLIDSVKRQGDTVVCVMSGNFTQRAEPAVFEKSCRTEAALKNGADIVLELPFPYAIASAEIFASNAVRILCEFGCDRIVFGVEDDDLNALTAAARLLTDEAFKKEIESELREDISYPAARAVAFKRHNIPFDVSKPNNILALEYMKALVSEYPSVEAIPVRRVGAGHDSETAEGNTASAGYIRNLIYSGDDYSDYVPKNVMECYKNAIACDREKFEQSLRTVLRIGIDRKNGKIAFLTDELESRIENSLISSSTSNELYDSVKTKRYTHSRVRRAVLCKAFSVTEDDVFCPACYIRVLGFSRCAEKELGRLSRESGLPVISSYSQLKSLSSVRADRLFALENDATDIYLMCCRTNTRLGYEKMRRIIKL